MAEFESKMIVGQIRLPLELTVPFKYPIEGAFPDNRARLSSRDGVKFDSPLRSFRLSPSSLTQLSPSGMTGKHSLSSRFETDFPIVPPVLLPLRACYSAPLPPMPAPVGDPPITSVTDLSRLGNDSAKPKMRSPREVSSRPYVAIDEIFGHQGGGNCEHFGNWFERNRFSGDSVEDLKKVAGAIQKVMADEIVRIPPIEESSLLIVMGFSFSEGTIEFPQTKVRHTSVRPIRPPMRTGRIQYFFMRKLVSDADRKLMAAMRTFDRIRARFQVADRRCLFLPMRVRNRKLEEFLEPMKDLVHILLVIQDAELRYYCEVLQIEIAPGMLISPEWQITQAISGDGS
jgi:hypothetical protein